MRQASGRDLVQALGLVRDWYEAATADDLVAAALAGLGSLVACDAVGWNEIDLATGRVRFRTDPPDYIDDADVDGLARMIDEHPIVRHYAATGDGSAVAISDLVGVRAYRRSGLYGDVYRPLGVEDQLAAAVEAGGVVTGVAFSRGARTFTARDREMVDVLRPHLVSAYRRIGDRAAAAERLEALERSLEEQGRGVLVLREGRIEAASREGLRLLDAWFEGSLPALADAGAPLVVDRGERRLAVRRVAGDPDVVLLDETSFAPDPERVRELGLRRREAEVLALVARGLSDGEIARTLVLSVRTVHKHLENAYRTLGVGSRRDAVARLLGR